MKKRDYPAKHAISTGWTSWQAPNPGVPYRFACCDCGLVHDIEFNAVEETNKRKQGWWTAKALTVPWRVLMRVRRNEPETAILRARKDAA